MFIGRTDKGERFNKKKIDGPVKSRRQKVLDVGKLTNTHKRTFLTSATEINRMSV